MTQTPAPDQSSTGTEDRRADSVFEGGGVKGLAFAGALAAAEKAGVEEWVNVAGTSAGAIVAALLVAGYDAAKLKGVLERTEYKRFADYGPGGMVLGGLHNALRSRGVVRGRYFRKWLGERLAESPLGTADPTLTRSSSCCSIMRFESRSAALALSPSLLSRFPDLLGSLHRAQLGRAPCLPFAHPFVQGRLRGDSCPRRRYRPPPRL